MNKLICIDPGHGGSDRSNKGKSGYVEADGMLKLSRYLKEELAKQGFQVMTTRDIDTTVSLQDRAKTAINSVADFFISLHTNAGGGAGVEVFHSVRQPGMKNVASYLSKKIADEFGLKDRGAKTKESTNSKGQDYYPVINLTSAKEIPVLLVENMFHDNVSEEKILLDENNLKTIAKIQCKCICEYFKVTYKEVTSVPSETVKIKIDEKVICVTGGVIKGKSLVSARELLEQLGYGVGWDGVNGMVTAKSK